MSGGGIADALVPLLEQVLAKNKSGVGGPLFGSSNDFTGGGGKGGLGPAFEMQQSPQQSSQQAPAQNLFYAPPSPYQAQPQSNAGRIVDPTLLAQQDIIGRAPASYQPLVTPDNYQDFYKSQIANAYPGMADLLYPDYRDLAAQIKAEAAAKKAAEDAAKAPAASGGSGGNVTISGNGWAGYGPSDTSYTGWSDALASGYNANGQYSVAPVENRGTDTGFGGYGGIDGMGASMTGADADVAFGADNYGGYDSGGYDGSAVGGGYSDGSDGGYW